MKKTLLSLAAALLAATSLQAQNRVNLTLQGGAVDSYETDALESIEIDGPLLNVNPKNGSQKSYSAQVTALSFIKSQAGHVQLTEAGGWFETTYVKWNNFPGAENYYVYVKGENLADWTRLDYQLVRNYGTYGRADMVGLRAGSYAMKVVPVVGGQPVESAASETAPLTVKAHDRAGFAHLNFSGVGAYKDDGTLKDGAKVIYVNANNAKTVSTEVVTGKNGKKETKTGMQQIIYGYQKGLDPTPITFRILGRLSAADMDELLSSSEGLQIKGSDTPSMLNITIEGIGDDATIHGFGFLLRSAGSIELRNFAIMNCMDDCVSIDTDNGHVWVHNLDLFYGQAGGDADQAKGDGTIDMKGDSKYITVSYNTFHDSGKSSLCGMKSESGPNWITYHHNWFDHSDSRHPRIRTMSVHAYNNYYDGVAKYGVGATTGADAFVEANYFRDCKYPILTSKQGSDILGDGDGGGKGTFSGEDGGSIKAFGNIMKGVYWYRPYSETNTVEFDCWEAPTRDAKMPSTLTAKQGGDTYSNWDTDPSLMYSYTPDAAADVPSIVKGVYGAGRINHGDFHWVINNNLWDKDYNVLAPLKTAVVGYVSGLVGNYEGDTRIGNGGEGYVAASSGETEGDETPFGDGNGATGSVSGGGSTSDPVEAGDVFMASEDGSSYFLFNEANSAQVNAWISDGTISFENSADGASSFVPDYTHADLAGYTGSLQMAKNGGKVTIKCPSVSSCNLVFFRSGSYKGSIEVSKDGGATWSNVYTFSEKKGVREITVSATSSSEVLIRVTNTSTGGLNLLGARIIKAKAE